MPRIPVAVTNDANTVGILNTIRDNMGEEYRQAVPVAEATTESIRMVGSAINGFEPRRNAFINALVNRIGLVIAESRMYQNPLAWAKRGILEYGETVEEIYTHLANSQKFDPATAEHQVWKRELPNVKTMFHSMNFQRFYKITVSHEQLRQAFLSLQGVENMITEIINSMYNAMWVDEFLMTKYMIAVLAVEGNIKPVTISDWTSSDNANSVVTSVKALSDKMTYMSGEYNIAGVENFTPKDEQYLIQTSDFSAYLDVESLAKAFNLDYVKFMGHQAGVDSFTFNDWEKERLTAMLSDDPGFDPNVLDNASLADVGAILVDRKFFMIFDNFQDGYMATGMLLNPDGLYYNEDVHVWKTFSASPFANAIILTKGSTTITDLTVYADGSDVGGETVVVEPGAKKQFTAEVSGTGFFNRGVIWSVSGDGKDDVTIDQTGKLSVSEDATSTDSVTLRCTSAQDSTQYVEVTVPFASSQQ